MQPAPTAYALQPQNPPSFTWSRHPKATDSTVYTIEIRRGSEAPARYTTTRNWFLPTTKLEHGTYAWRVVASNAPTEWSTERGFVINPTSSVFEVPDSATMRARASRSRPRMQAAGFLPYSQWDAARIAERGVAYKNLGNDVIRRIPNPAPKDSLWTLTAAGGNTAAFVAQQASIHELINKTSEQLEAATLMYRLSGNQTYLDEALKRGDELAALSPSGPTSFVNQDQGTRAIALALSKATDLLDGKIDGSRRARWIEVVRLRGIDMYNDLSGNNGRLDQFPFDSHGANNLGFLALVASLMLNEFPEAAVWFDFSTRAYIHSVYAWSGPEGGYSQGTYYGGAAIDGAVRIWDPLTQLTGVNLFEKPWAKGFTKFFVHFVPPGQQTHLFGDGHEAKPYAPMLKALASRVASSEARWYYNNLTAAEAQLTLLNAPYPLPVMRYTGPVNAPPNGAVYPSIGWAAMHSDLWNPVRTSLYFKSSPYGAYTHSHADQNGIVLMRNNKLLLSETGWYDYYGSPMWSSWYRATKAHNAITFDGGVGQPTTGNTLNLRRKGKITAFSNTATLDYVEGDATAAYDGLLTGATRKVWYMRGKDQVVVLDKLSSLTARSFEWNFHAPVAITKNADGTSTIVNGTESLCIRPLTSGTTFETRVGATPKAGTYEAHAAYTRPSATSAEFLMLLDIGCKKPAVSLTTTSTGRTLSVGGQTIVLPR
ncbi:oligo alginate lyase [Pseudoduganella albidiflava]|uniref:Oligo alginate lyase n=1 Tax=Pseudoduganella albidiflava TaxID=321983 RepID=A0AA87XVV1_9BURK|nr:oligo alginate lyase [Pseudoduganella albidiflava]